MVGAEWSAAISEVWEVEARDGSSSMEEDDMVGCLASLGLFSLPVLVGVGCSVWWPRPMFLRVCTRVCRWAWGCFVIEAILSTCD